MTGPIYGHWIPLLGSHWCTGPALRGRVYRVASTASPRRECRGALTRQRLLDGATSWAFTGEARGPWGSKKPLLFPLWKSSLKPENDRIPVDRIPAIRSAHGSRRHLSDAIARSAIAAGGGGGRRGGGRVAARAVRAARAGGPSLPDSRFWVCLFLFAMRIDS